MGTAEVYPARITGHLHFEIKSILAFARITTGDVFEVHIKHGSARWKAKCKVLQDKSQRWDQQAATFSLCLNEPISIKVYESRFMKLEKLNQRLFDPLKFVAPQPQSVTMNLNNIGSIKLQMIVTWFALPSSNSLHPASEFEQNDQQLVSRTTSVAGVLNSLSPHKKAVKNKNEGLDACSDSPKAQGRSAEENSLNNLESRENFDSFNAKLHSNEDATDLIRPSSAYSEDTKNTSPRICLREKKRQRDHFQENNRHRLSMFADKESWRQSSTSILGDLYRDIANGIPAVDDLMVLNLPRSASITAPQHRATVSECGDKPPTGKNAKRRFFSFIRPARKSNNNTNLYRSTTNAGEQSTKEDWRKSSSLSHIQIPRDELYEKQFPMSISKSQLFKQSSEFSRTNPSDEENTIPSCHDAQSILSCGDKQSNVKVLECNLETVSDKTHDSEHFGNNVSKFFPTSIDFSKTNGSNVEKSLKNVSHSAHHNKSSSPVPSMCINIEPQLRQNYPRNFHQVNYMENEKDSLESVPDHSLLNPETVRRNKIHSLKRQQLINNNNFHVIENSSLIKPLSNGSIGTSPSKRSSLRGCFYNKNDQTATEEYSSSNQFPPKPMKNSHFEDSMSADLKQEIAIESLKLVDSFIGMIDSLRNRLNFLRPGNYPELDRYEAAMLQWAATFKLNRSTFLECINRGKPALKRNNSQHFKRLSISRQHSASAAAVDLHNLTEEARQHATNHEAAIDQSENDSGIESLRQHVSPYCINQNFFKSIGSHNHLLQKTSANSCIESLSATGSTEIDKCLSHHFGRAYRSLEFASRFHGTPLFYPLEKTLETIDREDTLALETLLTLYRERLGIMPAAIMDLFLELEVDPILQEIWLPICLKLNISVLAPLESVRESLLRQIHPIVEPRYPELVDKVLDMIISLLLYGENAETDEKVRDSREQSDVSVFQLIGLFSDKRFTTFVENLSHEAWICSRLLGKGSDAVREVMERLGNVPVVPPLQSLRHVALSLTNEEQEFSVHFNSSKYFIERYLRRASGQLAEDLTDSYLCILGHRNEQIQVGACRALAILKKQSVLPALEYISESQEFSSNQVQKEAKSAIQQIRTKTNKKINNKIAKFEMLHHKETTKI